MVSSGIDSINTVPIQFLMAKSDTTLPVANAETLSKRLVTLESFDFLPDESYDHDVFEWINTEEYIDELIRQIELVPTKKTNVNNSNNDPNTNDDSA